jgi:hypothetical protein
MTFDEAWKVAFADNKYRKPQEIGREVFLAGQRSGFSLGTEAAAKAAHRDYEGPLSLPERIRAIRYEDVKGEKDVQDTDG